MIKPNNTNTEFELGGINHVALVCSDMARTVDFYSNILGMPLIKSLDLPDGGGQHFFFDAGNGDCVAFFWFADAPDRGCRRPRILLRSRAPNGAAPREMTRGRSGPWRPVGIAVPVASARRSARWPPIDAHGSAEH